MMHDGKPDSADRSDPPLPVIGWREWVALPELGVVRIKAKVDSGARSSSIHAVDLELATRNGVQVVRFRLFPGQRNDAESLVCEAPVKEFRAVRSSNGLLSRRPVIVTTIELLGEKLPVELTLADRSRMGFRMLLGREAFRRRFFIDAGRSYRGGRPPKKSKRVVIRRRKKSGDGAPPS